ncbi:MAG: phage baseplate assembly protein V [Bryobacteraceae bacterium]|nr:phage baseplate assembly protein V [Bryobacteraceae bacterium]
MDSALIERLERTGAQSLTPGFAVAPGVVTEPLDTLGEGRVKVRIPAYPDFEPWARVCSVGAGDGRGFVWTPQIDDEVLVAFAQNDLNSAFVLGGLWSTVDRPPLTAGPEFLIKRKIKTGVAPGVGHEVEFDDALQSIKITTSTQQQIVMDPLQIKLSNAAGTLSITMDNASQTISIQSAVKVEVKAAQIAIEALATLDLKGALVNISATGPCVVQGKPIKLN